MGAKEKYVSPPGSVKGQPRNLYMQNEVKMNLYEACETKDTAIFKEVVSPTEPLHPPPPSENNKARA